MKSCIAHCRRLSRYRKTTAWHIFRQLRLEKICFTRIIPSPSLVFSQLLSALRQRNMPYSATMIGNPRFVVISRGFSLGKYWLSRPCKFGPVSSDIILLGFTSGKSDSHSTHYKYTREVLFSLGFTRRKYDQFMFNLFSFTFLKV